MTASCLRRGLDARQVITLELAHIIAVISAEYLAPFLLTGLVTIASSA
jgi:hypothetical protein